MGRSTSACTTSGDASSNAAASPPLRSFEPIEDHAAESLTAEDVAVALSISVRVLQEGFRRFKDHTPSGYVREVRLRRSGEELTAADPTTTSLATVAQN